MRTTTRVRVRLDFVLAFDRELDSIPAHNQNAIGDAIVAWSRAIGLDKSGAEAFDGGARVRIDLDFRSPRDSAPEAQPTPAKKKATTRTERSSRTRSS